MIGLLDQYDRQAGEEDWQRSRDRRPAGMPVGVKAVGDILPAAFREGKPETVANALSSAQIQWDVAVGHFRNRRQAEGFGAERIARDVAAVAASCARVRKLCESPIEHQIAPWLICQNYGQWKCGYPAVHIPREDRQPPDADLMIIPQFAFARFRLDFAIVAKYEEHLRIVAVETDGSDYHDKTRDFRRDAYLLGWNIPTVRASGSEVAKNPQIVAERVARQILDWACKLGLRP